MHPANAAHVGVFFREWLLSKAALIVSIGFNDSQQSADIPSFLYKLDTLATTEGAALILTALEVQVRAEALRKQRTQPSSATKHQVDPYDVAFSHAFHIRLFRTGRGYLGLGSQSVRSGDSVWIVSGSPVHCCCERH